MGTSALPGRKRPSVDRRRFLRLTSGGAVAAAFTALAAPASETRFIAVHARKFEFTPSEITVNAPIVTKLIHR